MKRILLGILLVLFNCTWVSAEALVWKAQKGNSVMYLGGTFHMLRNADYPLPPEFNRAYKASETVVLETDMARFKEPGTQQMMMARSIYNDGSTVDKHLSPRTFAKLKAYCASKGIQLDALSRLKPSMLMVTLTMMEIMKLGAIQQGVDHFFSEQARIDGKVVEGLETVEEQLNYIVSMADGNEDEFVTHSISDIKVISQQFDALANAWRSGDADKLESLMVSDLKSKQPQLYKRLITERNNNWMPRIEAYLNTPQTEFVLVGAAHLVGPDGIIQTLRKKGYSVDKL